MNTNEVLPDHRRVAKNTKRAVSPAPPIDASLGAAADEVEDGLAVEVVLAFALEVVFKVVGEGVEDAATEAGVVETPPAKGAVVCPLICAWTAAVNWPDMPDIWYFAENAKAGYAALVVSLRFRDSKRTKYSLLLGPMVGFTTNTMVSTVLTSTEAVICCSKVCC